MADVKLTVCLITYNQEQYVVEAIESALMQKTNFPFEIVICDDGSTDKTGAIIKEYAAKYPNLIKPFVYENNIGMMRNWVRALLLCKQQYIAFLEGDDFWNDPNKLQKQVDILDKHPEYVTSFTNAHIKYEGGASGYPIYVTIPEGVYTTKDLLDYNFMPTCSVVMRNFIMGDEKFFHPAYFKAPFADWVVHIINSKHGSFHFLNEFTCTYRINSGGTWGAVNKETRLLRVLKGLDCFEEILDAGFKNDIRSSRKKALQNTCAFYRTEGMWGKYLKYRMKLLLN